FIDVQDIMIDFAPKALLTIGQCASRTMPVILHYQSKIKDKIMARKNVEMIVSPPAPHYVGDGFRVHNFIPSVYRLDMKRMDPFIMLDYNSKFNFPPSQYPKGVGVHPHRGFETVTIAYQGSVAHHDSAG